MALPISGWAVTYGEITVNGTKGSLTIYSPEGRLYDSADYVFWGEDGVDYSFSVNQGYTLDYAYLYFGDGTGQVVSESTPYPHVFDMQVNYTPSLILVFTDESVEEILGPELWEAFSPSEEVPEERPESFTPPQTTYPDVNDALDDNGTSTSGTDNQTSRCICAHLSAKCKKVWIDGNDECNRTGGGSSNCIEEDPANCPK